jgi:DNA sulfur modification protein DndD
MQLKQITLNNFGPFRGEHKISLQTDSERYSIVLVGGENGSGKTTFLEAVQLTLFGRMANGPRQKKMSYENYLEKTINRNAKPKEGAWAEIILTQTEDGQNKDYCIRRQWLKTGKKISEKLEVFVDQIYDKVLSEDWQNYVYHFVPPGISQLFFFDGEQIEALANPEQSSEIVKNAIQSLLGIDIVEQLETDLQVVENQERKKRKNQADQNKISELEKSLKAILAEIRDHKLDAASIETKLSRLNKNYEKIEAKFVKEGGDLTTKRHDIEAQELLAIEKHKTLEQQLVNLSSGCLPLLLTEDLLHQIYSTGTQEKKQKQNTILLNTIHDYNQDITSFVQQISSEPDLLNKIKRFLHKKEEKIASQSCGQTVFNFSDNSLSQLDKLLKNYLAAEEDKAQSLLAQIEQSHYEIGQIEQKLATIPDNDAIASIIKDRNALLNEKLELENKKIHVEKIIAEKQSQEQRLKQQLARALKINIENDLANKDSIRLIDHSEKVRETLKAFKSSAVTHHTKRLEKLILQRYKSLLHKESLVDHIIIDPDTCLIRLQSPGNYEIDPERLSAGERQLLAIAILWGLATASGRKLPVIIDTPLGRLDTAHRMNLVKSYFPKAGEQVILLSTDEEIDKRFFDELRPWIAKKYIFQHSETQKMTTIKEGYFWKEDKPWQSKLFEFPNMEETN